MINILQRMALVNPDLAKPAKPAKPAEETKANPSLASTSVVLDRGKTLRVHFSGGANGQNGTKLAKTRTYKILQSKGAISAGRKSVRLSYKTLSGL